MNTLQTIEQMRQSPYVKEKQLGNGISSFNFTRKAFWDNHWTAATIKARGLFIDTTNNRIKARGFDKFFEIGQRRETELNMLAENFEYPVKAYIKYNGYLGICAGEPIDPDGDLEDKTNYRLWCASKSTDQSWYAARFEDLLRTALGSEEMIQRFAYDLYWKLGCSALFEVIDPINDPHIIEYDQPQVVLLALVFNDDMNSDYWSKSDEVVEYYNATWKLNLAETAYVINNAEELYNWYEKVTQKGYTYNGQNIEGFVLKDVEDHMVKVKTYYYKFWKAVRGEIPAYSLKKIKKLHVFLQDNKEYENMAWRIKHWCRDYYRENNNYISVIELQNKWKKLRQAVDDTLKNIHETYKKV